LLAIDSMTTPFYAFWSASGSVFVPLLMQALVVGLAFWWHHQCEVHRCHRYARRTTAAGERACSRHHPASKPSARDLHDRHHAALRQGGSHR
jgi:hypothetical protein